MARIQLRDLCGVRSGDKGNISDLSLFADDDEAYDAIREAVTAERVKAHFGSLVQGPVERYEARNVLALKFVMHDALGGGGPRSLRADNLGKTFGAALLRMWIDVPDDGRRRRQRDVKAPVDRALTVALPGRLDPRRAQVARARPGARRGTRRRRRRCVDHPTETPERAVGVDAHGLEHRRRLERLGRARAARVHGDAGLVEAEQDGLRLDAVDAEAHEVGERGRRGSP